MKLTQRSHAPLATVFALVFGAGAITACQPATNDGGGDSTSPSGSGGRVGSGGSSGNSSGSGGSTTSGSGGSTSSGSGGASNGGSSGGSGGATGSGGMTAGSGGASGGSGGASGTGGSSGTPDGGGMMAETGTPPAGGKLMITVEHDMATSTPARLCFKKDSTNSGGDKSPKIDWTAPPPGTKSFALTVFDQTNSTPHQVICNITPDVMGRAANQGTMIPPGAEVSTGHGKPGNMWYGPGAGEVHAYAITIWALAVDKFPGGCGGTGDAAKAAAKAAHSKLQAGKADKALVLDFDTKVLHGSRTGACK